MPREHSSTSGWKTRSKSGETDSPAKRVCACGASRAVPRRTFTGVPVLPQLVALSAVALVGTVDVGTLLTARAGQALVHIWRLEDGARHRAKDRRPLLSHVLPGKPGTHRRGTLAPSRPHFRSCIHKKHTTACTNTSIRAVIGAHTHTPSQFLPSPDKRKPEVHEHWKEPGVFSQVWAHRRPG